MPCDFDGEVQKIDALAPCDLIFSIITLLHHLIISLAGLICMDDYAYFSNNYPKDCTHCQHMSPFSFFTLSRLLEHLHPCSGCSGCGPGSIILTSKISYSLFCPTSLMKLKPETAKVGRLLIATHLEQSNQLANQQLMFSFAAPVLPASPSRVLSTHTIFAEPSHNVLTFLHPKCIVQCIGGVAFNSSTFYCSNLERKTLIIRTSILKPLCMHN